MPDTAVRQEFEKAARADVVSAAQLPFAAMVVVIVIAVAVISPSYLLSTPVLIGVLLTVLITVMSHAVVAPSERISRRWKFFVPVVDFAIVALLNVGLSELLPALIVLVMFPVMWVAYSSSRGGLSLAFAGVLVVSLVPLLVDGQWPTDVADWINHLLLPALASFIAISVRVAASAIAAVQSQLIDTTRQLQQSLAAAEDREIALTTITNTVDAGILVSDHRGNVVLRNDVARGYAHQGGIVPDGTVRPAPFIYAADRVTPVAPENQMQERARRGETIDGDIYWIGEPGNQRALTGRWSTIERVGEPDGFVVVTHDVTELVEAIAVRDEFLSTVSHELRTPLTNILGYLDLVDAENLGIASEIGVVENNARRLLAMITDLLSPSTQVAHRQKTDIAAIVAKALDAVSTRAQTAGIELNYPSSQPFYAEIDAVRVRKVVDHLLMNAVKFTPAPGAITVSLRGDGTDVHLAVADTGVGMSADELRQAFGRFYRAPGARTAAVAGSGLGLSIAQADVHAHGGSIHIASTPGEGSVVSVRLPLRATTAVVG